MFTDDETASPWDAALRFRDQAVECKFWASARPRLLRADRLLATAAVIGGNLSVFLAPGVSRAFYLSRVLFAATLTALQCAALACMRHDAAYYFHYRTCLVAAQRITRLAGLAFFGAMLSGWSVAADLPARSLAALQAAPTGWLAFAFLCNALAFGTSAAYHLAHSLAFPARFPLQLLFQTLALPVLAAHTGAAVKALREPLLEAAVCRVYGIMRRTILLPMDGQKCCTVGTCPPQAAVVLGWTVAIVLGYFTPLYVSYVTELCAKQRFADREDASSGRYRLARGGTGKLWRLQVFSFAYINLAILFVNATAALAHQGWI